MLPLFMMTLAVAQADRPPEVGVTVEPLVAVDLSKDSNTEDTIEAWTWIRARAKQQRSNGQWFLGIDGEHQLRHGADTEAIWRVRVAESGWSGSVGPTYVRTGMLIERWGKLDFLPVVDVLNPQDLRAGPLATIEALRTPTPMVTGQVGSDTLRAELVLQPFPGTDQVPLMGSDWSLIRPGMIDDFLTDAATWEGGSSLLLADPLAQLGTAVSDLDPSTMRALNDAFGSSSQPEDIAINGNAAGRIEWEGTGVDLAIMAANLRSSSPATTLLPAFQTMLETKTLPEIDELNSLLEENPLAIRWPRTWMSGAEISTVAGPVSVRAEGAWWSNKVVQQPWLNATTRPAVSGGLGLDWSYGSHLMIAAEGRYHRWIDPPNAMAFTAEEVIEIAGTVRVTLAQDRLTVQTSGILNTTFAEGMVRPELNWRVSDPISIGMGAVIIDGPGKAPQTLLEALAWEGGPLTTVQDNDSVFATLRWIR